MLTLLDFRKIEKGASKLFANFELDLIKEMAERIASVGEANTVVYNNTAILQEMGIMYDDVVKLVAKYNNQAEGDIEQIFFDAGIKTLERDDTIYKLRGLSTKGLSEGALQILNASVNRTNFNINRLTSTTAQTSQEYFLNAMNKGYLEVATGSKTYSQVLKEILKDVPKGATVSYNNGVKRSIESAVRTNIVTAVNQTCGTLQLERAKEMNCDLMELTAHIDSRPTHAEWQGKIVSLSGAEGYLSLDDIGYGDVTGFKGINCRHDWYPYYEGMPITWKEDELEQLNNTTVMYNGKELTLYEATQRQRALERDIRKTKKQIASLEGGLNVQKDNTDISNSLQLEKQILRQNNANLNDFLKQTGLQKQLDRIMI